MLTLINVSIDHGRLKADQRTHMLEAGRRLHLSWGALSDRQGAYQSACRASLTADGLDWDSGWIQKRAQSISYEGPLPEGDPIRLRLKIRDDSGEESAAYEAVIYNASVSWRAGWIGDPQDVRGRTVYFRREFTIDRPVRSAVLYACGIGYEKLSLNGEPLDDAALDPAFTDYTKTCQYLVYPDLQTRFHKGKNCLGAMIGNGWRRNVLVDPTEGEQGGYCIPKPFAGQPLFTAMLRVTYETGDVEWLHTDGSWQCGCGAHAANDLFNGEVYDANRSVPGWNKPGFDGFGPACPVQGPGGVMRPMILTPIIEHRIWPVIASWPGKDGALMLDFGQNMAGVVRIRLSKLNKGQSIKVTTAEELDEDGELFTAPLRKARACDVYVASGDQRDLAVWQPLFTYHGFRYARVEGLGAGFDASRIEAVELHTDMEKGSFFRCGDPLVTAIHEACVATERANQHSILTDCPQRDERQGWMNDATVRFEETPYNFDTGRMFPKIIRDIIDAQGADGSITCTAPYVFGGRPADPVCSSFLVAGQMAWLHDGNAEIIEEAYDHYAAWEKCLLSHSEGFIVDYGYYGDWAGPVYACMTDEHGEGALSAVTPTVFMSTGYSYYNCRLLARFAELIGRADQADYWRGMAASIRQAMLDKWYDAGTGKICTGSQGCQTFALWLGIIPDEDAAKTARLIHDDLVQNDYRLTTGNLCSRYIMDVLSQHGYLEDAWRLITRQTYPSFGYMLQQEATTIWERWELKKDPGMNSHDHPMYAAVDQWFYAGLCGIRPTEPGYDAFTVRPLFPASLMSAQAVIDTVKGQIGVRWMKRYGRLHLHVTVPFGTRARVIFAGDDVEVGSGFHTFSAPLDH